MAEVDGAGTDNPASVLVKVDGSVGTVTLNRPKAINALDHEMALAMEQALLGWAVDSEISAAIVRGAGIVACVRAVTSSPFTATPRC